MLMYSKVFFPVCLLLSFLVYIKAQGSPIFFSSQLSGLPKFYDNRFSAQALENLSQGAEKFSLQFLRQISDAHISVPTRSYMISPFAVWSLLLLLTEAAEGNTLKQLRDTLFVGDDQRAVRAAYHTLTKYLSVNTTTIEVASFNALFTNIHTPVSREYEDIIERDYRSSVTPVDFYDVNNTFTKINKDIREATRGLIPYTVTPQDFQDANMLMISSLYFKGKWKLPFDASKTVPLPFHDEDGNVLGDIPMMIQTGPFNYALIAELNSLVLELPYGNENRLSMLILLPVAGVSLNKAVNDLANVGLKKILEALKVSADKNALKGDEHMIDIFIPKFTTESHFTLRPILRNMGIVDMFDSQLANLDKLGRGNFVSSIFHATRIIVDEEGTEAGAVTTATLHNKIILSAFKADRPFAYMIVEKTANLLLFAGEIRSSSTDNK